MKRKRQHQGCLDDALQNLVQRIRDGQEYPDAAWATSQAFDVAYSDLQEAYDNL